jgi:hypothetical protein
MRALVAALVLSVVALITLAAPANAALVTITPVDGGENDVFIVAGEGLEPGLALDVNFKAPSGQIFSTAALDKVVVVADDGTFSLDILPSRDFAGETAGTWQVQVCVNGTNDCVQRDFDITV